MDLEPMKNQIIIALSFDGRKISGRLADFDDKYIKLTFKTGKSGYMAIADIKFISPLENQPTEVV